MSSISTVCVYDDLTAGQSAVAVRSADHKTAGRIYEELRVLIDHLLRKDRIKYIFPDIRVDLLLGHIRIMLGGKNDCIQSGRLTVLIVLDGYLSFSVRTQVGQRAILAYLGQLQCQLLCQCDRIRHIFVSLVCRITEHHTLVPGTDGFDLLVAHLILFCLKRFIYAHCDIGRLLVDRCDDTTRVCIETIFSSRIADLTDCITDDLLNIDISLCRNLTHNEYKTGRGRCLAGNTAHRILLKQCIKNRI